VVHSPPAPEVLRQLDEGDDENLQEDLWHDGLDRRSRVEEEGRKEGQTVILPLDLAGLSGIRVRDLIGVLFWSK
jgi:hypothetical protein